MEKESVASLQDGAGEKLVDEKIDHNLKGIEIKYTNSQNGDAKLDIDNVRSAFAGMGKEELMKFANDPFWVRTRWVLFILFWLIWIAMLAGAIAIIILAPKCSPPTPREWWEQSPVYRADALSFSKEPESAQPAIGGLTSKLKYLQTLGVKTLIVSNILKVDFKESDGKEEFKTLAPSFSTLDDFKTFLAEANKEDIKVVLQLIPNHSSLKNPAFNKSVENDPKFSSFYIWALSSVNDENYQPTEPNFWRSQSENVTDGGGSAWQWNAKRKAFYLHQFDKDQPEFNFYNPDVVKYFDDVMTFWLDLGVSGFFLERAAYLLEDKQLHNETRARHPEGVHTQYSFYDHSRTKNLPELESLLAGWKTTVSRKAGVLFVDGVNLATNVTVVDLNIHPQQLDAAATLTGNGVQTMIETALASNKWPAWQVTVNGEEEGSPLSQAVMLSTMLLPGVPVTRAGQELGIINLNKLPLDKINTLAKQSAEEEGRQGASVHTAYRRLVKERASPSILYGSINMNDFNGSAVFAYTRIKSGNPGYLVVLNTKKENVTVDLRQLQGVPNDLKLVVSSNYTTELDKKTGATVVLPGHTVNVYNFVPLKE